MGPDGIVQSLLLFGEIPKTYPPTELCRILLANERGNIIKISRTEMRKHLKMMCNKSPLAQKFPALTDYHFNRDYVVLFWGKQVHYCKQEEFMGPYKVDSFTRNSKMFMVFDLPNGLSSLFSVT